MTDTSNDRSRSSSITDDKRTSRIFIKNGIGGAGNYRTVPATQPAAPDLPRSFASTYDTSNSSFSSGRGGSGNTHASHERARHVPDNHSTPPSSFSSASSSSDITPKRNRAPQARGILPNVVSTAPRYVSGYRHCGIGGAGNVKNKPSQPTAARFADRSSHSSSDTPRPYYARNPPPPVSGADQLSAKLKNAFGGLRREKKGKGKDGTVGELPNEMVVMQGPYDLGRVAERTQGGSPPPQG